MTDHSEFAIRPYRAGDQGQVVELWLRCGLVVPQNDAAADIARKIAFQPSLLLVGMIGDRLVATAMVGYEGHRGWINYLGVLPEFRRMGLGGRMVDAAEADLRQLGCPKLNLQVRSSNHEVLAFYERLGFVQDDVVSMGKRFR